MKRLLKILSLFILFLAFLCVFAASVRHVVLGNTKLGVFSQPLKAFASFPGTVKMVLSSNEILGVPPTFDKKNAALEEINNLDYDVYGINAFYNTDKNLWDIRLFNFHDDSVIYTWELHKKDFIKKNEIRFESSRPINPLLLPDRSLVLMSAESENLYKLDKDSRIIWHNTDRIFHHSINLSTDNNIWVCTTEHGHFKYGKPADIFRFHDNYVTKISLQTGEILYDKSVSDIFTENGYANFVYGFSNGLSNQGGEPFHLNDIEPVFENGPFWEKGDLFLSLRHKSLIIHYRPATNKIIRLIYGPFLRQHDVDIISDREISVFNNNSTSMGWKIEGNSADNEEMQNELIYSEILIYNYEDSAYRPYLKDQFVKENIYSYNEALCQFLKNGDVFVESQNDAILYIMNEDEIILKKQYETDMDNRVHIPNWVRLYENINF